MDEEEEEEESCNTELGLGLSIIQFVPKRKQEQKDSNNNDENYSRKKLRLTKEQTNLLEDNFKLHSSLNSDEKHALAEQLNLQPRQVEVWFQNKRARTKLKKTEVECEFLEKCCKSLSDENQILKKQVQRLRALKQLAISSAQFNIQLLAKAAVTLTMCSACENNILQAGEGKAVAVLDVVRQPNKLDITI